MVGGILSTIVVGCGLVDFERFLGTFAPGFLPELLGIPIIIREVRFGSPFDLPMMLTSSVNCSCSATATMWLHSLYDEYIGHWVSQLKPPFI